MKKYMLYVLMVSLFIISGLTISAEASQTVNKEEVNNLTAVEILDFCASSGVSMEYITPDNGTSLLSAQELIMQYLSESGFDKSYIESLIKEITTKELWECDAVQLYINEAASYFAVIKDGRVVTAKTADMPTAVKSIYCRY